VRETGVVGDPVAPLTNETVSLAAHHQEARVDVDNPRGARREGL
jgi:hypothetical protein